MNKRVKVFVLLVFLFSAAVFCDSAHPSDAEILHEYQQSFFWADLPEKIEILKDAASDEKAHGIIAQFYEYALLFALYENEILKDNPDMIRLIIFAARGLGNTGYRESLDTLWPLFIEYQNKAAGADLLMAIGKLGNGSRSVTEKINHYLLEQNEKYSYGASVNYTVISVCIAVIMDMGDSSSYPALFSVLCSGYPEVIVSEAAGAMELIPGNYAQFLIDVIGEREPAHKFAAFRAGINSERLSASERGHLAELSLEQGITYDEIEDLPSLSALRHAAVTELTQLRWTRASALAVRHYFLVQADYQQNNVSKMYFLEAVECLGAVGNTDAARALLLQLSLINIQTARDESYDEEITLAVIRALGLIGDKAAFDQLTQVTLLDFSANIKAAAREALDRLRW